MPSVGRGQNVRGTRAKKPSVLPNLSAAGKRETVVSNNESRGQRRGGRRERGAGRDRRRDRRPHDKKAVYIEQQGIFSMGLNDDGRHNRPRTSSDLPGASTGRSKNTEIRKDEKIEVDSDVKPITYESEWRADDEADEEELRELLDDDFISDLKPGAVMPIVLPEKDKEQFRRLVAPVVKQEEIVTNGCSISSFDSTEKKRKKISVDFDNNMKEENMSVADEAGVSKEDPGTKNANQAGATLLKLAEDGRDFFVLQLPSTLAKATQNLVQDEAQTSSAMSSGAKTVNKSLQHCLEGLPNGATIGKLRISKKGRVEMSICGVPLEVNCSASEQINDYLMMTDSTVKCEEGDEKRPIDASIIGKVASTFVCSHNLPEAIDAKRKKQLRKKAEAKCVPKEEKFNKEEMDKLLEELKELEKKEEAWEHWASDYYESDDCDTSEDA